MPKDLTWFKWKPADWAFGNIQRRSKEAKVAFVDLLGKYWNRRGNMTIKDAELGFGKQEIAELMEYEIIKPDEDGIHIRISFLDEQLEDILETSEKNSSAGKESARRRMAKLSDRSTVVEPDPNRQDKNRQEQTRTEQIKSGSLVDIWLQDLENSTHLETIAKMPIVKANGHDTEWLKKKIPDFRNKADLEYPNQRDFINHFKNWVIKGLETKKAADTPMKTTVTFGKKNRQ